MSQRRVFKTYKERGEWVELRFMAEAMGHGYKVSKPWGEVSGYDVGVQSGSRILRVQVKSTDCQIHVGYLCRFRPNSVRAHYTTEEIDFFAAYVIPQDAWYLIPAGVLLSARVNQTAMLCPMRPLRRNRYRYEQYREAWELFAEPSGLNN